MRINPLPELRNERARMLAEGVDLLTSLSSVLAMDALALGAGRIAVNDTLRPWGLVVADRDWITSTGRSVEEAFGDLLLWPETSKYFRSESRVLAIASGVFIWRASVVEILSGEAPPVVVRDALKGEAFAVGFCCD